MVFRSCNITCRSSIFLLPFLMACTETGCSCFVLNDSSVHMFSNFWLLRKSRQTVFIFEVTSCINLTGSYPDRTKITSMNSELWNKGSEKKEKICRIELPFSLLISFSVWSLFKHNLTSQHIILTRWARSLGGQFLQWKIQNEKVTNVKKK